MTNPERESLDDISASGSIESLDDISASGSTDSNKKQKVCGSNFNEIWSFYIKGSNRGFREAALVATSLWQSLNHTEQESRELVTQLRRYNARLPLYDLPYVSGMDTPIL
ncbi:1449_t:CDS:2, partial [Cetraspora pellucida]